MSMEETPVLCDAVRVELSRVLESPEFRTSKRCQEFLRFVVEATLDGRSETLKERTIGVELLGRAPDYDSGLDAAVRVRANEVRKRLKQYYTDPDHTSELRLELPAGSYVPEFRPIEQEPAAATPPALRPRPRRLWYIVAACAVIGVVTAGFATRMGFEREPSALERFWEPARRSGRPMLLCMDYVQAYSVPREFGSGGTVPAREIVPITEEVVGAGGIYSISALTAMLTRMGVELEIRIGPDTSFGDLRHSPVVVMGAYNNRWSSLMYDGLRFGFSTDGGSAKVEERKPPFRHWRASSNQVYGLLSRVFHSTTGGMVIGIAGITHNGTRAVAEFATNAAQMEKALAGAPAGWEKKNLQILLQTQVITNTPAPAKALAVEVW